MKAKNIALIVLGLAVGASCFADRPKGLLESLRPAKPGVTARKITPPRPPRNIRIMEKDDTIYCVSTISYKNWQIPLDTVPKEDAKDYPFIIRLSNRNKRGHYCRLEVLGQGLLPRTYSQSQTAGWVPDSLLNTAYQVIDISRCDYLTDSEGEFVTEERLYGLDNELLLTTVYNVGQDDLLQIDEKSFSPQGLPVNLAHLPGNEQHGLTCLVMYPDGNSRIKALHSGRTVYSRQDGTFYLLETFGKDTINVISLDSEQKPMMNRKGYSGERSYYNKHGRQDSTVYIDPAGRPMEVIGDSSLAEYGGISKREYILDKYGTLVEERRYGLHNRPAATPSGTHRMAYVRDGMGNLTEIRAYGLHGEPTTADGQAWSHQVFRFDSLRNITEFHQYDRTGKPVSGENELSSFFREYDNKGIMRNVREYTADDSGAEKLSYSMVTTPDSVVYRYADESKKVNLYDRRGRLLSSRTTDKSGALDSTITYPYSTYKYTDCADGSVETVNHDYRPDGSLMQIFVTDSLAHTVFSRIYDTEGRLTDSSFKKFDESWSRTLWQKSVNDACEPVRRAGLTSSQYYKVEVDMTISGNYRDFHGLDEFGENDYMVYDYFVPATYNMHNTSRTEGFKPVDEYEEPVEASTLARIPKYMSVEVTDPKARELGLRDNDIILSYGDADFTQIEPETYDFLGIWAMNEILSAPGKKSVTVFRIDSVKPERCSVRTIELPAGTTRELGFLTHLTYKTDRQQERILRTLRESGKKNLLQKSKYAETVPCYTSYPEMTLDYRNYHYGREIGVAGIPLRAQVLELPELKWTFDDEPEELVKLMRTVGPGSDSGLHVLVHYYTGRETVELMHDPSVRIKHLYYIKTELPADSVERLKAESAKIAPAVRRQLTADGALPAADALWKADYRDMAVELYEGLTDSLKQTASPKLAEYYKTKRAKNKKYKQYRAMAIGELSGRPDLSPEDAILLGGLYADEDSVKAARYLADYIHDMDLKKGSDVQVWENIHKILSHLSERYSKSAQPEINDAKIYAALHFYALGLRHDSLFEGYLLPLYQNGTLQAKREDINMLYYIVLSRLAENDPKYQPYLADYLNNCIYIAEAVEKETSPAYAKGMRGKYVLLSVNDWTLASSESWYHAKERMENEDKHARFLTPEGEVIELDFGPYMGLRISPRAVSPEEREKMAKY